MSKKILYLDIDGVLGDFKKAVGHPYEYNAHLPEIFEKGFFANIPVMPGSQAAVQNILDSDMYDVYIASKPAVGSPYCCDEKVAWIEKHYPALAKRIILICDKRLLLGDFLIDDDIIRWGKAFKGTFLHFNEDSPLTSWITICTKLGVIK